VPYLLDLIGVASSAVFDLSESPLEVTNASQLS
jgi:hypothetical protein